MKPSMTDYGLRATKKLDAGVVEFFFSFFFFPDTRLIGSFRRVKVSQISRGQNSHADSLAALASSLDNYVPRIISIEVLNKSSIER